MSRVSTLIYEKRVISRISQSVVAENAGCSTAMISAIEREDKTASLDLIYRITETLDIDKGEMLDAILMDLKDDFKEAWKTVSSNREKK